MAVNAVHDKDVHDCIGRNVADTNVRFIAGVERWKCKKNESAGHEIAWYAMQEAKFFVL